MAIIQISKIQHRTGSNNDLPQLDEGEFGFATDERKLYIGNDANLYPPSGNTTTQTEILTEYSNISFSQIDGSANSGMLLSAPQEGQVLTISVSGNTSTIVNRGGSNSTGIVTLPDAANLKIYGGVNGYILQTDGTGNVSWVSKDMLRVPIIALSNATPMVMTVANTTPYVNSFKVTISGVQGTDANTVVNGKDFYVKVDANFPTNGNVTLYTDSGLTTPAAGTGLVATANTGVATSYRDVSGLPAGTNTQIQFNNSGVFGGNAGFTFDKTTGIFSAPLSQTTIVAAASAQPNITSLGTLTSVNSAGNITAPRFVSNVANGSAPMIVSSQTLVANLNADFLDGLQSATTSTGNTIVSRDANGSFSANVITANLVGTATNANTVTTNAQPNITSVGTLTSLSVTGTTTTGNLTTGGNVTATGNVSGNNATFTGNVSGNNASVTGSATISGEATVGSLNVTGNVESGLVPSISNTYNLGNATNRWNHLYLNGNSIYIGDQSITTSANGVVLSNTTTVTNINGTGNISVTGNISGNVITGNSLTGQLRTAAQPNITSVGTLTSLAVSGNISSGNISATGSVNASTLTGSITTGAQPNITSVGTLTQLAVTGTIAAGNVYANSGTVGANLLKGTLVTNAQPNITSVGTLTSLNVDGNVVAGNLSGANTVSANYFSGVLTTGSQPNITQVGTLGNLNVLGNLSSGNANLGNLAVANYISATITAASGSQPNITAVGTLTAVSVTGNVSAGNVLANAGTGRFNAINANGATITGSLGANIVTAAANIIAGGSITGASVVSNADVRVGNVANDQWGRFRFEQAASLYGFNYDATSVVVITNEEANMSQALVLGDSANNGALFGISSYAAGNATPTTGNEPGWTPVMTLTGKGDFGVIGNVAGSNLALSGNATIVGNLTIANISAASISASGNLAGARLTVTGNITSGNASLGNLATANYFSGDGSRLSNINAANITGQFPSSNVARTVSESAQPNITSVGTMLYLNASGNVSGNVGIFNSLSIAGNIGANNLSLTNGIETSANIKGNIVTATSEFRVSNVPADSWGRMRMVNASSGYGFSFGDQPYLVLTNEELSRNEAIVLGEGTGGTTLFGVSYYTGGNGQPTTGNEVGWTPRLNLTGDGKLTIANLVAATNLTASNSVQANTIVANTEIITANISASGTVAANNVTTSTITMTGLGVLASVDATVPAAGTAQSSATQLDTQVNVITTSSPSSNGVKLPDAAIGATINIVNVSGETVNVWPFTNDKIDALATNSAYALINTGRKTFIKVTATQWYSF